MIVDSRPKYITWNGSRWEADDLFIRLLRNVKGKEEPLDIDKNEITIKDEKGWLTMGTPEDSYLLGDKTVKIPIVVREDVKITPPGDCTKNVRYDIDKDTRKIEVKEPNVKIENEVKVTVKFKAPVVNLVQGFLVSVFPVLSGQAGQQIASAATPTVTTVTIRGKAKYQVKPPTAKWHVEVHDPCKLSDTHDPQVFYLYTDSFPEGWLGGADIKCGLSEKSDKIDPQLSIKSNQSKESETLMAVSLTIEKPTSCFTIVKEIPEKKKPSTPISSSS